MRIPALFGILPVFGQSKSTLSAPSELPHFDALDGLRGVAVSMVVLFHFWQTLPRYNYQLPPGITRALGLFLIGQKGVDLFFVLSGFLITGILLQTKGAANYFRTFYLRRALRIFPLYFLVVLSCLAIGAIWGISAYSWRTNWWYLFYLQNVGRTFWPSNVAGPGHFWSLAVEEHYYLFWPLAVAMLSRRTLAMLCAFLIVLPIVIRALFLQAGLDVFTFTLCRLDTLAMGSLLAILLQDERSRQSVVAWSRVGFWPIAGLSLASFFVLSGSAAPLLQTFKYSLFAGLCSLVLVLALSPGPFNFAPRIFKLPLLRSLGKISYAMYVFHPFVLGSMSQRLYAWSGSPFFHRFYLAMSLEFLLYLIITVAVARLSWAAFEGPILRLKARFEYRTPEDKLIAATPAVVTAPQVS